MAKREEANSGLRAGFMTEEEALRQRKQSDSEAVQELPAKGEEVKVAEPEAGAAVAPAPELKPLGGPSSTIEMQGISGKVIKSVIKVVKKKPQEDKDAAKVEQAAKSPQVEPVAQQPALSQVKSDEAVAEITAEQPELDVKAQSGTKVAGEAGSKGFGENAVSKSEPDLSNVQQKTAPAVDHSKRKEIADKDAGPQVETVVEVGAISKEAAVTAEEDPVVKAEEKVASRLTEKQREVETRVPVRETNKAVLVTEAVPGESAAGKGKASGAAAKSPTKAKVEGQHNKVEAKSEMRPTETAKPRIRPQKGSYVGKDSDRPLGSRPRPQKGNYIGKDRERTTHEQRRSASNSGGGRDNTRGSQPFRGGNERPGRGQRPAMLQPAQMQVTEEPEIDDKQVSRSAYASRNQKSKKRRHDEQRTDRNRERQDVLEINKRRNKRRAEQKVPQRTVAQMTEVTLPSSLTVKEFAEALKKTTADVIVKLMGLGMMATINQEIDFDTAAILAAEYGITANKLVEVTEEDILFDDSPDKPEDLAVRPPVVVVMGHVDHGKTSILDYIRNSRVASGEAGGITQHIGAYMAEVNGRKITFLDTPGHEAFTTMRARGAQVTDIAVLVVAADDGVMPQTIEAINHARAANTEIIVAINKIDRPQANLDKVKMELSQHELMDSDWGGNTTIVPVSAKTGENMDELLEMILLTADVLDLKANPKRQAKGTVIEAKLDKGRGPVATVLVQRGTLRRGDAIVLGSSMAHVRMMLDDCGGQVQEAGPSTPVEIIGLSEVPEGGEVFYQVENEKVARALAERRRVEEREDQLRKSSHMSLDSLFAQMAEDEKIDLNVIVKADVQGSVEAVRQSLEELSNDKITVRVIHGAVGGINESDIRLAEVSNAIVIGFNVRPSGATRQLAADSEVEIRLYRVIYEMIEEMEQAMKGMLAPEMHEVVNGNAEVRNVFKISGVGTIAGCYVTQGVVHRSDSVRIVRASVVVYEGKLSSLKRFKDDAREVKQGYECGIGIERYNDIKVGDELEFFALKEVGEEA